MRETLTLIGERVATGDDFLRLGAGVFKTPGWRHLVADFTVSDAPTRFSGEILQMQQLFDMDTGLAASPSLNVNAMNAIFKHCRMVANLARMQAEQPKEPA